MVLKCYHFNWKYHICTWVANSLKRKYGTGTRCHISVHPWPSPHRKIPRKYLHMKIFGFKVIQTGFIGLSIQSRFYRYCIWSNENDMNYISSVQSSLAAENLAKPHTLHHLRPCICCTDHLFSSKLTYFLKERLVLLSLNTSFVEIR